MKWNKFTIKTTTQAEDFLSAMLDGLGIEGIEIENNVPLKEADMAKMFIDFLPQLPPDEGISYVSFYLEDGKDGGLTPERSSGHECNHWSNYFRIRLARLQY